MKLKKMFILFVLVITYSSLLNAQQMNSYWLTPEDRLETGMQKGFFARTRANSNDTLDSLSDTLESFQDNHYELLEKSTTKESSKWGLTGFKTVLGLSLSGKIGLLSWGGGKGFEIIWKKNAPKNKNFEEDTLASSSTLTLDAESTYEQFHNELSGFVNGLEQTGKIVRGPNLDEGLRKISEEFYQMAQGVENAQGRKWIAHKLWLEFKIDASGTLMPYGVNLGAGVRVRLEYIKKSKPKFLNHNKQFEGLTHLAQNTLKFANSLANELGDEALKTEKGTNFKVKELRFGLGVSVKGNIGIVTGQVGLKPYLFLKPVDGAKGDNSKLTQDIALIDASGKDLKISKRKLKKGIKKALKFGQYFTKHFSKEKYAGKKWLVKEIKSSYKFSLSGSVGVVNLKGEPSFTVIYENTKL